MASPESGEFPHQWAVSVARKVPELRTDVPRQAAGLHCLGPAGIAWRGERGGEGRPRRNQRRKSRFSIDAEPAFLIGGYSSRNERLGELLLGLVGQGGLQDPRVVRREFGQHLVL